MAAKPGEDELLRRRENVRREMRERGVAAVVIAPGANLYYLTGYWGHISRRFTALVLGACGETQECFVSPGFELSMHGAQMTAVGDLRGWEKSDPPEQRALGALRDWGVGSGRVALDPKLPWDQAAPFVSAGGGFAFEPATALMGAVRMVKSAEELALMGAATRAAAAARAETLKLATAGVLESEIEKDFIERASAVSESTDTWNLALFGPSSASPHGVKDRRRLAKGDVVLHDFGTTRGRYHSDTTRTAIFGKAGGRDGDEARRVWEIVRRAYLAARTAARPGVTFTQVDEVARKIISDMGYGEFFTHGIGHGIGLEIHEPPYPEPRGDLVLREGTTVTIEPGIYLRGRFGVRLEDTVVVTEEGGVPVDAAPEMGMEL